MKQDEILKNLGTPENKYTQNIFQVTRSLISLIAIFEELITLEMREQILFPNS